MRHREAARAAAALILGAALVWAPEGIAPIAMAQTGGADCPSVPGAASPQKGPTGYETPPSQPTEKSAILPAAPQNEQSAAPTVQQDGQPVVSETECPVHSTDPNAPSPKG